MAGKPAFTYRCNQIFIRSGIMYIIAGLGNPGLKYAGTRHNTGFCVIDELADRFNIKVNEYRHKALTGRGIIGGEKVILVKPQTFMNLSGESIRQIMDFYKLGNDSLIVAYDDISLDVGQLRLRTKGSAGGHNGMKNIIAHTGSQEFDRVRIGVGEKPERMDLADYVLGVFSRDDQEKIREAVRDAASAVEMILAEGMDKAMSIYNQKR